MSLELFAVAPDGNKYLVEVTDTTTEAELLTSIADTAGFKREKVALSTPFDEVMLTEMGGEFLVDYKWRPTREEAVQECTTRNIAIHESTLLDAAVRCDLELIRLVYAASPVPLVSIASTLLSEGNTDILASLAELGGDLNETDHHGETILGYTIMSSDVIPSCTAAVSRLVELGADINKEGYEGRTPLMYAALKGNASMIRHLVSLGAEVGFDGEGGDTALHYAARGGHDDAIHALHELGADVNAVNRDGNTPLHVSARSLAPSVPLLVELGASLSILNKDGQSALHTAVIEKNLATVSGLLSLPASQLRHLDTELVDSKGETAVSYAKADRRVLCGLLYHGVKAQPADLFRMVRAGQFICALKCVTHAL